MRAEISLGNVADLLSQLVHRVHSSVKKHFREMLHFRLYSFRCSCDYVSQPSKEAAASFGPREILPPVSEAAPMRVQVRNKSARSIKKGGHLQLFAAVLMARQRRQGSKKVSHKGERQVDRGRAKQGYFNEAVLFVRLLALSFLEARHSKALVPCGWRRATPRASVP